LISVVVGGLMLTGMDGFLLSPDNTSGGLLLLPRTSDWLWLGILSLCCTVWAQSLALSALRRLSAFTVTLSVNLEPVYGILLAFVFFNENKELHWGFFAGMALICCSVAAQTLRLLRSGRSRRAPATDSGH